MVVRPELGRKVKSRKRYEVEKLVLLYPGVAR